MKRYTNTTKLSEGMTTDLDLLSPNSLEEAGDAAFTYPTLSPASTQQQATKNILPLTSNRHSYSCDTTAADNNDYWDVKAKASSSSGVPSPVSRDLSFYPGNSSSRLPSIDEDLLSRHSSTPSVDTPSRPQPSFSSTQNLSRGFFTSIRKLRNPSIVSKGDYPSSIQDPEVIHEHSDEHEEVDSSVSQHSTTNTKLEELRQIDVSKVGISRGLQRIRLEMVEMREQDKALFMQLMKLHTSIKEIRSDLNHKNDDTFDESDDWFDLSLGLKRSKLSPRYSFSRPSSTGYMFNSTPFHDFSSSEGSQLLKENRIMRRGTSLDYHRHNSQHFL